MGRESIQRAQPVARSRARGAVSTAGSADDAEVYRTLVNALDEGFVLQRADGVIEACNPSAERILGLTRDQMAGMTSMDPRWSAVHEDGSPFPGETHPAMVVLATGRAQRDVIMGVHRPDDAFVWISISSIPLRRPSARLPYAAATTFRELDRTREALRQSDARYAEFLNGLADPVFAVDRDKRYTVWNTEAERVTGRTAAGVLGRTLGEIDSALTSAAVDRAARDVLGSGTPRSLIEQVVADTGPGYFSLLISPTIDGASFVARDISDLMRSDSASRESEERYRAIFAEAPIGIALVDSLTGCYLDMNERHAAIVGRTRAELVGADWMSITHPDDIAPDAANMARLLARSIPGFEMRKRYIRPDGSIVWAAIRVIAMQTPSGSERRNLTIVEDITEREAGRAAVMASEARFRALFENAPLNSVIYRLVRNPAGEIVDWEIAEINDGGAAAIGIPAAKLPGRRAVELFGADVMAGYLEISRDVARTGQPRTWEEHFAFNDRTYLTSVFMAGEDLYANVSVDISEHRRTQDRLERAERMDLVGRLASGVAHDFNNLLAAISGYAELLTDTVANDDPRGEDIRAIREAAARATVLTRRLLMFGQQQTLQTATLDLRALTAGLAPILRSLAGDKVDLTTPHCGPPLFINADHAQIEQVIINLVVNARDAMPDGGSVVIALDPIDDPSPLIRMTVADSGSGINAEALAHIFEPFYTTKEPGRGTGLGLSVVDAAVSQAGGSIAVETVLGKGTTFTVDMPAVSAPAAGARTSTRHVGDLPSGTETILLVDNEPGVLTVVARMLRECGYTVIEAGSAAIALAIAESGAADVDLLVSDVVMPGINGFDLAERLLARRPDLPVLFISAYATDAAMRSGLPRPGSPILSKPFGRGAIAVAVRTLLDARVGHVAADRLAAQAAASPHPPRSRARRRPPQVE